ncbi:MAG: MFS transporter [Bacillota bacterium]|nr:MFS transporter [Bacillota bacterium]
MRLRFLSGKGAAGPPGGRLQLEPAEAAPSAPSASSRTWLPPSFIRLWAAQTISMFGENFSGIAQAFIILKMTGSPTSMGLSMALGTLPRLLASLFGGVVVDRLERKRVLMVADIVSGCVDLVLAAVIMAGRVQVWHIYVVIATRSLARAFYDPALNSLIPALVDRKVLVRANATQQSALHIAAAAGPALAGVMVESAGAGPAVLLAGLTFLVSSLLLATTRASSRPTPSNKSAWQDLRAGLVYVRQRKWILSLTVAFTFVNMVTAVRMVVMPFISRDIYGRGMIGYGLTLSAGSAGSLAAIIVLAALKRLSHKHRMVSLSIAVIALSTVGLAFCPSLEWALPVCFVVGLTGPVMGSCANALYQEFVPSELMGRVFAFRATLAMALMPLANVAAGYASNRVGPVFTLAAAGLLSLPGVVLSLDARHAGSEVLAPAQQS